MKKGLVILLLFVMINIVVVGGQKLAHLGDSSRLNEIRQVLDKERPEIDSLENELGIEAARIDQAKTRLLELDSEINAFESKYPKGIPKRLHKTYNQKVNEYNSMIAPYEDKIQQYNIILNDYNTRVDSYNSLVDEAKALSAKIGTTWYIVPRGNPFR